MINRTDSAAAPVASPLVIVLPQVYKLDLQIGLTDWTYRLDFRPCCESVVRIW